jgi:hypothetical protein
MRNFIAVQTFEWGRGTEPPVAGAQYEIRVVDGDQKFREYPDGKKEREYASWPPLSSSVRPAAEWSELPTLVGTNRNLKIRQAGDAVVGGRKVKVFQYRADVEDAACGWMTVHDFVFFSYTRTRTLACYGEVWTDEDMNILRMSENLILGGRQKDPRIVLTYGWLKKPETGPLLVPLTIALQGEFSGRTYWCRGQFMNYRVFTTSARIKRTSLQVP